MSFHIDQAARKIEELEDTITANDECLQRLQKSHAELLESHSELRVLLKTWRIVFAQHVVPGADILRQTDMAIANAEKLK